MRRAPRRQERPCALLERTGWIRPRSLPKPAVARFRFRRIAV